MESVPRFHVSRFMLERRQGTTRPQRIEHPEKESPQRPTPERGPTGRKPGLPGRARRSPRPPFAADRLGQGVCRRRPHPYGIVTVRLYMGPAKSKTQHIVPFMPICVKVAEQWAVGCRLSAVGKGANTMNCPRQIAFSPLTGG